MFIIEAGHVSGYMFGSNIEFQNLTKVAAMCNLSNFRLDVFFVLKVLNALMNFKYEP
jgi:tRNA G10  N-methylase Trm11